MGIGGAEIELVPGRTSGTPSVGGASPGMTAMLFRMADASHNKGEEAILAVILDVLRPVCSRIVVCESDPDLVRARHGVEAVKASQTRLLSMWRSVGEADLAVWAGGHMAQDISSQWSILGRLWLPMLAKARRCRLLIFAVDIGPLRTRLGRALSREFFAKRLDRDDLIVVRNEESRNLLIELGVDEGRIGRAPDPAFSYPLCDRNAARRAMAQAGISVGRPIVAIAPRATFHMKSGLLPATVRLRLSRGRGAAEASSRAFQRSLARTIDRVVTEMDVQIVLVPMDTGPNPRDDLLCAGIAGHAEHGDRVRVIGRDLDVAGTVGLMAEADLVVSGRFHGCVFACIGGTPVVPVDTGQEKVPRLMRMLGYPRRFLGVGDIARDASGGKLYEEVRAVWDRRREEGERIRERVAACRREWEATVAMVQRALS